MGLQTLSIIAGSEACNARCPFCISKMTPPLGVELKEPEVNWRNFGIGCELARDLGATTAMFTGKGEPTLFPEQINKFLKKLKDYGFPLIEVQTNGIIIFEKPLIYTKYLEQWYQTGITTIAISIVHYEPEKNRSIYVPYKKEYIDLPDLIRMLHEVGFSVRLTCIGARTFIDSPAELMNLLAFAKQNKVEQVTLTPVNKPDNIILHQEAWDWSNEHHLTNDQVADISKFLESKNGHYHTLGHGARVYDVDGQNICLNQCLTVQPDNEVIRNLIFFPDGHIRTHWQYEGSVIL